MNNPFKETDTGFIINAAVRYSIGRRSYAPGLVMAWVRWHWDDLDDLTKRVMLSDLEGDIADCDRGRHDLGYPDQDKAWREFRDWIKERQECEGF